MASYSMHYSHGRTDLYDVVVPQGFTAGREPMGAESEGRVKDSICERKSKIVKVMRVLQRHTQPERKRRMGCQAPVEPGRRRPTRASARGDLNPLGSGLLLHSKKASSRMPFTMQEMGFEPTHNSL